VIAVLAILGGVACWGILESVVLASIFTLIEVGGLVIVIVAAAYGDLPVVATTAHMPPLDATDLSRIAFGSLLAFFAFIGFEDLANVVEEAQVPHRDIPSAMILTLLISTILYVVVAAVAVTAVPIERLSSSSAPLSLVFREVAGVSPATISAIAIVATLNAILAQMTVARSGYLRRRARAPVACRSRTCESMNRNSLSRDRAHCSDGHPPRAVRTTGIACRRHLSGNPWSLCACQSIIAAASLSACAVQNAACNHPCSRPGGRICDLHCHNGVRLFEVGTPNVH